MKFLPFFLLTLLLELQNMKRQIKKFRLLIEDYLQCQEYDFSIIQNTYIAYKVQFLIKLIITVVVKIVDTF